MRDHRAVAARPSAVSRTTASRHAAARAAGSTHGRRASWRGGASPRQGSRAARSGRVVNKPLPRLDRDALEHVGDRLARVDGGLERLEDVLPADHDHRVDAVGEQRRDRLADDAVALVLEPVDLDEVRRGVDAGAQPAQRADDLLGRARRARRRSLAPAPSAPRRRRGRACRRPPRRSRRCRRARWPARARRPARAARAAAVLARARWMMSWVMRSPSCSHAHDRGARSRVAPGSRRAGRAGAARSAGRCVPTPRRARAAGVGRRRRRHRATRTPRDRRRGRSVHNLFTSGSRPVTAGRRAGRALRRMAMQHAERASCRSARWRSARASAWRVAAGGTLALSVRELELLGALARSQGRIVAARGALRDGVGRAAARGRPLGRRLRPQAARRSSTTRCRSWRFIHTHVGFGYRFEPERSHAFHNPATGP